MYILSFADLERSQAWVRIAFAPRSKLRRVWFSCSFFAEPRTCTGCSPHDSESSLVLRRWTQYVGLNAFRICSRSIYTPSPPHRPQKRAPAELRLNSHAPTYRARRRPSHCALASAHIHPPTRHLPSLCRFSNQRCRQSVRNEQGVCAGRVRHARHRTLCYKPLKPARRDGGELCRSGWRHGFGSYTLGFHHLESSC